jgi:outer membrane receptor protein involved in Fe transport
MKGKNFMKLDFRQRLLASTLLASAGLVAMPAYAQDTQSTVPDQNLPTNPGAAPPTGPVESTPTPTPSATGEPVQQQQDIIVTGTRIPQPNLESAAPVTVVSNQDIKLSGLSRIDDVLNQLPSAAASQGPGLPNPATGTAEIDLRYLGAKRTLSLVNGRRMTPGDPNNTTQAGDVNLVPAFMVKRVEVLTGGASSVYGADAVAGVVNFIMDTDFDGLRLDGQISGYQHNNDCPSIGNGDTVCDELNRQINVLHRQGYAYPSGSSWDGKSIDVNAAIGSGFDDGRGHVMAYFGYRKQNAVTQAERDYSACTLNVGPAAGAPFGKRPRGVACGGSQTSGVGTFYLFDDSSNSTFFQRGPNNTLIPGDTRFNYAPYNHWIRPDERYVGGAFANYEIRPEIQPYMEFMFMDDKTQAQIAPSGDFGSTYTINCDNPFIQNATDIICQPGNLINGFIGSFPTAVDAGYNPTPDADPITFFDSRGNQYNAAYFNILRRNVEGGPRQNNLKHTTFRGVVGTRGDLSNAFSYDAYYQYGKTNYSQVYKNEFSQARLVKALNAVNVNDNGQVVPVGTPNSHIVCRSVLDNTDPNCVPYDILGTPSAGAINYLNVYGVISGETSEQIADINFTGQLGELGVQTPWANDGVGINVGYEYRHEYLNLDPDALFQANDLTGQGAATLPVNGEFHVNEFFGEIQIPIVQHNFIDELSLSGGYRHSAYDNSGNGQSNSYSTDTYKISAEFAPIADVRFRGSYNRAVRAPNIVELFGTITVALDGATDPCSDHTIAPDEYGCIAQGLQPGRRTPKNPAEQYNGLLGGNPDLTPEKATTKTVGVVLQPRFIPRFAFTVDYWNIKLEDAIQGFGADTIVQDCIDNTTATSVAASCALIHRNPAGSLWLSPDGYVVDTPTNVGRIKTDGFDFTAAYSHRLGGIGQLSASFLGTWLKHYEVNNGIAPTYDCAGYYGTVCSGNTVASSSAMPQWRHKMRATLQTPFGLGVSLNWRMVGKVAFEANSNDTALAGSNAARGQLGSQVSAQHYFDLAATYSLWDMVNLRAGVNNIFDKSPPIIPTGSGSCPSAACTGNTYPQTWDYLGRFLYLGATVDFRHKPTPIAPPPVVAPPPPPPAPPATITCPDGLVILANQSCPALPPPPPPPAPAPERGH